MSFADRGSWEIWTLKASIALCNIALNAPDPESVLEEYYEEAAESEPDNVEWVMNMWQTLRNLNAVDLERTRNELRLQLEAVLDLSGKP